MNYIVVDLEATCWDGWDKSQNETIEIGAVLVNSKKEIVSEFCEFIKPLKNPILSDFCKELTTIDQADVNQAEYFSDVVKRFQTWCAQGQNEYILCSWGIYDKRQFESDCKIHGIDTNWLAYHLNLKKQFGEIKQLRRAIGMKNALKLENTPLAGTHHRGIDDARNIAKIFVKYFDSWTFPKV